MTNVTARIKLKGKSFEIIVDCDKAVAFKKQTNADAGMLRDVLAIDSVYGDYKKGFKTSTADLKDAFNSEDIYQIASRIIKEGEILLPQEYRDKVREQKMKQVVDFLARNCIDPRTNAPYTSQRIESALKQAGARIDENKNADEQALRVIKEIESIIPIRIETKKIKLIIPAVHIAKIYNLIKNLKKEREEWLSDGSMSCIINLPAGMQIEFYDKLNSATQGTAITEEIKEN